MPISPSVPTKRVRGRDWDGGVADPDDPGREEPPPVLAETVAPGARVVGIRTAGDAASAAKLAASTSTPVGSPLLSRTMRPPAGRRRATDPERVEPRGVHGGLVERPTQHVERRSPDARSSSVAVGLRCSASFMGS